MNKKFIRIAVAALIVIIGGFFYFGNQTPKAEPKPVVDDTKVTTEGVNSVIKANNQFALDIYAQFKEKEKNVFFSPYSISTALAMVYEGARGKTGEEIQSVFHFPTDSNMRRSAFAAIHNQLNQVDSKYKLNVANALWAQNDYKFLNEYLGALKRFYAGKATNVDFKKATEKARTTINKWVEDKTNNKIKDLFPRGSMDNMTRLVLTNAIYFKGVWVKQFDKKQTGDEDFRVSSTTNIKTPMMRQTGEKAKFNYVETDQLQILEMPYEGDKLSMLVLLPKNDNLSVLEDSLTLEKLNEWKSKIREQRVDVFMPKFTFNNKYFLNETLKKMGMPEAFSHAADLSGMDGTTMLFIQTVIHQAFIDINEEGTEAVAASGVGVGLKGVSQVVAFRADHPFIFMIQDRQNGNILFFGRMVNPTLY